MVEKDSLLDYNKLGPLDLHPRYRLHLNPSLEVVAPAVEQVVQAEEVVPAPEAVEAVEHPEAVENFKKGKENALKFLVGQVMRKSKGRANPQVVNELLRERLGQG